MEKIDYSPVPALVDALLSEGLHPSVERVRARLGAGSNQTISRLVRMRLHALGRLALTDEDLAPRSTAAGHLPTPDPAAVRVMLTLLRSDTHMARAEAMAERFNGGSTNGSR